MTGIHGKGIFSGSDIWNTLDKRGSARPCSMFMRTVVQEGTGAEIEKDSSYDGGRKDQERQQYQRRG